MSEMSSVSRSSKRSRSSTGSQSSTASSKKLNRKKRSLKKNSPEEHLAILEEVIKIHSFITKILVSINELSLVAWSTTEATIDKSWSSNVGADIAKVNALINRIWNNEHVFTVSMNQFAESEANFEESFVKPL